MAAAQRLAALIWAAILLVAVQLVPSAVAAHPGHTHASHHAQAADVAAHQAPAAPSAGARSSGAEVVSQAAQLDAPPPHQTTVAVSAEQLRSDDPCSTSGCNGSCCGTCVGCCGAALLATPVPSWPGAARRSGLLLRRADLRAGIDPDALGKPPKSLA
ncbi:MAG: hypothetical protein IT537_05125 [Hyphomicrobiales bacterium]|nr:hypothetical protein [Hyphomicrobiales bacterium]